jgi:tetrahydromethanopterin S-methyltransferase subunit A
MAAAHKRLQPVRYDCLGCQVCYPALAMNALHVDIYPCPTGAIDERQGWPPLPGSYTVLRYRAPVAICTLTDEDLAGVLVRQVGPEVAVVGTLQTENLGIERLIMNVLVNPHIRFLILCGADSRQAIGHLSGQSLVSLAHAGLDSRSRIVGARGKRPVLRNISHDAVEHFRRTIAVIDLVNTTEVSTILSAVGACAARHPGPAEPFAPERIVGTSAGYLPARMVPDPAGYFVLYVDRPRGMMALEHYRQDGVLDAVIEGDEAVKL